MKKVVLFLSLVFCTASLFAQCDELFISEYVEGYANNKAIELYNPTSQAIDLSTYSLCRFSNGATTVEPEPAEDPLDPCSVSHRQVPSRKPFPLQ